MSEEKKVVLKHKSVLDGNVTETVHKTVKDNFGGKIPYSVWNLTKSKQLMTLVGDNKTGRTTDKGETLSELNPDTVIRCLKIWSEKGDKVFDPFLNRGSTSILSAYMERIGYANDIVPRYIKEVELQKAKLLEEGYKWAENIHLNCGDARDIVNIIRNIFGIDRVDYIITSPPFWDVEKYISVDGQMSDMGDYDKFMEDYAKIIELYYEILKPDKFVTYIVNDFRRNKQYYWFSGDTINCFLKAGFVIHDIVISVVRTPHISGIGDAIYKRKTTLKYHEYVLTFRKVS